MALLPLDEWDADYLDEVSASDEKAWLEKKSALMWDLTTKASKAVVRGEIAKQVSAFANSGDGFLVFGVDEKAAALDVGVPATQGRQPIKQWVEAEIPRLLSPPVTTCQARLISQPGHHIGGHGALVIHIPLSHSRPHQQSTNAGDVAYIRAGEHSAPMRLQTLLDIRSRGAAPRGEIVDLGVIRPPHSLSQSGPEKWRYVINPRIRLTAGPICRQRAFELKVQEPRAANFEFENVASRGECAYLPSPGTLCIEGSTPLFPNRPMRVMCRAIAIYTDAMPSTITASFFLEASEPVVRKFEGPDLIAISND